MDMKRFLLLFPEESGSGIDAPDITESHWEDIDEKWENIDDKWEGNP